MLGNIKKKKELSCYIYLLCNINYFERDGTQWFRLNEVHFVYKKA